MGATYEEIEFDGTNSESQIKKLFSDYQDECAHEDGNSYSGRLNMCSGLAVQSKTFDCYEDAADYISDHAQKWEDAIAVRYKFAELKQAPASLKKLSEKLAAVEQQLRDLHAENRASWRETVKASKFVTCGACKSKLAASHLHHDTCPVCHASIGSSKASLKLEAKVTQLREQLNEKRKAEQKKAALKGNATRWLIGGWCAC